MSSLFWSPYKKECSFMREGLGEMSTNGQLVYRVHCDNVGLPKYVENALNNVSACLQGVHIKTIRDLMKSFAVHFKPKPTQYQTHNIWNTSTHCKHCVSVCCFWSTLGQWVSGWRSERKPQQRKSKCTASAVFIILCVYRLHTAHGSDLFFKCCFDL